MITFSAFSALTLLVGRQEWHPACKKWGMVEVLVSPNGVAPSRVVGVSASVNLLLHHKVQKFSSKHMIVTVSRHHFCLQYKHVYDNNWCQKRTSGLYGARED